VEACQVHQTTLARVHVGDGYTTDEVLNGQISARNIKILCIKKGNNSANRKGWRGIDTTQETSTLRSKNKGGTQSLWRKRYIRRIDCFSSCLRFRFQVLRTSIKVKNSDLRKSQIWLLKCAKIPLGYAVAVLMASAMAAACHFLGMPAH
jgi:hypothetical protein